MKDTSPIAAADAIAPTPPEIPDLVDEKEIAEDAIDNLIEARSNERNLNEAEFKRYLKAEYGKAISNVERKAIGKIVGEIMPQWMNWGSQFIETALSENKTHGNLIALNAAVYAVAKTIKTITSVVPKTMRDANKRALQNLEQMKTEIMQNLGHITQELERRRRNKVPTPAQARILKALRKSGRIHTPDLEQRLLNLKEKLVKVKQSLKLKREEIARKRTRLGPINRFFAEDTEPSDDISPNAVREYWLKISGTNQPFRVNAELKGWRESLPKAANTEWAIDEHWDSVCKKAKSWKAPGPDGIPAFWWKALKPANSELLKTFKELLMDNSSTRLPNWFARGRVVLLPKGGDPKEAGNYRPIACLNTAYKLLTALLASQWKNRLDEVLPKEQLALRKGLWGCTHAHAIDQAIYRDVKSDPHGKREACVGWVDYSKAFDSVPHRAINWALTSVGVNKRAAQVYSQLMRAWTVKFEIRTTEGLSKSKAMKVKCGVLQGDTLSPLLFCLTIAPVSYVLNRLNPGYRQRACMPGESPHIINHLYYMDDLKIYTECMDDLNDTMATVKTVSEALNLHMNARKCATARIQAKGTAVADATSENAIPRLGASDCYKYLGMEQGLKGIAQTPLWERLELKIMDRVTKIWSSKLTFHQMVTATNACVMPILRYAYANSFTGSGTYTSSKARARAWDDQIKDILVRFKAKYAKTNRERLYLPTQMGGYGLMSVEDLLEDTTVYSYCYLRLRPDLGNAYECLLRSASRGKRSIITDMKAVVEKYEDIEIKVLENTIRRIPMEIKAGVSGGNAEAIQQWLMHEPTKAARLITSGLKEWRMVDRANKWKTKGASSEVVFSPSLDTTASFLWVSKGLLNARAVRDAFATQEGQLRVNAHCSTGQSTHTTCRRCGDRWEDACHVVAGCPTFRTTLMVDRHDSVARQMHYAMCIKFGIAPPHWRNRIPTELANDRAVIWWNRKFSEAMVDHNMPDLVVMDKVKNTIDIIEFTVVWWKKLERAETEKYQRYGINGSREFDRCTGIYPSGPCLAREMNALYKTPVKVTPLVIGTCGEVRNTIWTHLEALGFAGKEAACLLAKMQRSAVLGTDLVIRAHLCEPD